MNWMVNFLLDLVFFWERRSPFPYRRITAERCLTRRFGYKPRLPLDGLAGETLAGREAAAVFVNRRAVLAAHRLFDYYPPVDDPAFAWFYQSEGAQER